MLEKYNEVKSEIDQYSNAAHDAAVSTTVPPSATTANATATAATAVPVAATPAATTTVVATAATPAVATTEEENAAAAAVTPVATEEASTVPTTETVTPVATEEASTVPTTEAAPVTEAYMGHHRYDFEDEQDRLNQSTDGDELDEWFSKYSLLGNERERAQKLAELGKRRDATEQPLKTHQKMHRKMLLPNPSVNKKTMY